jgi:hypothetical protein
MDRLEAKEVHEQVDQAPSSKLQAPITVLYESIFFPFRPSLRHRNPIRICFGMAPVLGNAR